ncbi:hypothetical protein BC829DRAFT_238532 [Chytridium lagenaria]|nr:hypothetical protein BC829DRAFT_238532 [Chytridium lagenaria]
MAAPESQDYTNKRRKVEEEPMDFSDLSALEFEQRIVKMMFSSGESVVLPGLKPCTEGRPTYNQNQGRFQARNVPRLPKANMSRAVISYICQGPNIPGRFDPKIATSLGVSPGKQIWKTIFWVLSCHRRRESRLSS